MYINYEYYRIFYYVAKYKSFTQAANALLNNQPNITRTVKNLERELGCTLFVRSRHGVSLTPEGEKLYAHVRIAVQHIEDGEKELALDRSLQSGTISIGASEVALHCLLLPVLKEFRERYPGIHIRVSNHSTPQAITALKNGLVDFSVVTTPMELSGQMKQNVLKNIQEAAVCGSAYKALCRKCLTLAELSEYPLICLGAKTKTYEFYSEWFRENGLTLVPEIEAATADQILPMVRNNLGIGFVPEEFLRNEGLESDPGFQKNGDVLSAAMQSVYRLHLTETIPGRSICLVKSTEHSLSIAAAKLEQMLLSCTDSRMLD